MRIRVRKRRSGRPSGVAFAAVRTGRRNPPGAANAALAEEGKPLGRTTLAWSRRAFSHDFSHVRVHEDEASARAASNRGATAFTLGGDIYLGSAGRDLGGRPGRILLAHELVHVMQQRQGRIDPSRVEPVDSPAEREARSVAAQVMAGRRAPAVRHVPVGVPRDVGWARDEKRSNDFPDPYGVGYHVILVRAGATALNAVRDLASLEGSNLAVDRSKFDAWAPDRREAVLALAPHAAGTACESWFKALALSSGGGDFDVTFYRPFNGADGDVRKMCGIDITLYFKPAKSVRSNEISFVQMMKSTQAGTPVLLKGEEPRTTTAAHGDPGWAVDSPAGFKHADYGLRNDGTMGAAGFGYRKSDTEVREAHLIDKVRLPRDRGQIYEVQATSFALDKTHRKYLGGIAWGYDVDSKGAVTKKALVRHSTGAPTGIQRSALVQWNAQARNPDLSKRNHPRQVPVPIP